MEPEIVGKRIKELMKSQCITKKILAEKLEISINKLQKKLDGEEEFYINEMGNIKQIFNLSIEELDELFFKKDYKKATPFSKMESK